MSTENSPSNPDSTPINLKAAERWAYLIQQSSLCGRQLRRLLAQNIARWNVSDTEFLVLWACNHTTDPGLAQNELASMLGVSAAQMSGLAYDLRDRSLISFERTQRDRRIQVLRISGQGRLLLSKILADLEPVVATFGWQFPESDQVLVEQLLERLTQVAQQEMQGPAAEAEATATDAIESPSLKPSSVRRAS